MLFLECKVTHNFSENQTFREKIAKNLYSGQDLIFNYHISFSFFDMAAISSAISSEDSLM